MTRRRLRRVAVIVGALVTGAAFPSAAEKAATEPQLVYPVRPSTEIITVDGNVTPDEWQAAVPVCGFRLTDTGQFVRNQTLFRVLYDYEALYLGILCYESELDKLPTEGGADLAAQDSVEWHLRAGGEAQVGYRMVVTATGQRWASKGEDTSWSAEWLAKAGRTRLAWSVEAQVPFTALGVQMPAPLAVWAFNLRRSRHVGLATPEATAWALSDAAHPWAGGHLLFLQSPMPPELSPFEGLTHKVGGAARVFGDLGFVDADDKGLLALQYAGLLAEKLQACAPSRRQMDKLKGFFEKNPELDSAPIYWRLARKWEEIERQVTRVQAVSALTWVWGLLDLDQLVAETAKLYEETKATGRLKE